MDGSRGGLQFVTTSCQSNLWLMPLFGGEGWVKVMVFIGERLGWWKFGEQMIMVVSVMNDYDGWSWFVLIGINTVII